VIETYAAVAIDAVVAGEARLAEVGKMGGHVSGIEAAMTVSASGDCELGHALRMAVAAGERPAVCYSPVAG